MVRIMRFLIFSLLLLLVVLFSGCSSNAPFSKDHDFYHIYIGLSKWNDLSIDEIIRPDDGYTKVTVIAIWTYGTDLAKDSTGVFMFFEKNYDQWRILSIGFEEYDEVPPNLKERFVERVKSLLVSIHDSKEQQK